MAKITESSILDINKNDFHEIYSNFYENNLKKLGVKQIKKDTGLFYALEYLFLNLGKPVYIEEIKKHVVGKGIKLKGGDSLQIRHLVLQYGYNIFKGGDIYKNNKLKKSHFLLADLENTHKSFIKDKRTGKITNIDWINIKLEYDNKCVNCGSLEGKPLRWNKNKITELSQGHMDPRKPLTIDNVIPQCAICNQQYKNKAIFNKRGFVIDFIKKGFNLY
jgi:hypothetical protein